MTASVFRWTCISISALVIISTSAMAKEQGYSFILAYSYHKKIAYHTLVLTHAVKGKSFNEEEYVADVKLIRAMEDSLKAYLEKQNKNIGPDFTYTARTGYKSEDIAMRRLESDKIDLQSKGMTIIPLTDFKYKP